MEYFFRTTGFPDGAGFSYFDREHLLWLVFSAVTIALNCLQYRKLNVNQRAVWRKTVAVLLILNEIFKQIPLIVAGNYNLCYLPLHLCNINVFIVAIHAWRPGPVTGNFLYAICIPGALAALLFPAWTELPAMNFMYLHSFTLHILLVLYPAVLSVHGDIKPEARQIPKCLGLLLVMALFCYGFNSVLGTNFFFLRTVGEGNPLYWFRKHWGSHLLGFPVIIAGVLAVMYLPVECYRWNKTHKRRRPGIA